MTSLFPENRYGCSRQDGRARSDQKALAERMGCTQQYISKMLKVLENLSLETIYKLEMALGLHVLQEVYAE